MLSLIKALFTSTQPAPRSSPLRLEALEDRAVPAVAAGASGEVYATFYSGHSVYERTSAAVWTGPLVSNAQYISVGTNGALDVTFSDGTLWQRDTAGAWHELSQGAYPGAVAAGGHGEVFGAFYSNREVWERDSAGTWHDLHAGGATSLSEGADGSLVGAFSDGSIWRYQGSGWQELSSGAGADAVAAGPHGEVYGTFFGSQRALWERDASGTWHDLQQSGVTSLSAGADGALDAVFMDGSVRQLRGGAWQNLAAAADNDLGLSAIQFGLTNLGQPVLYHNFGPTCANFVSTALETVGAKSTEDFGVADPPNWPSGQVSPVDYVWGTKVLTYQPGMAASSLNAVQPGDVLQFRNVTTTGFTAQQHTAIVYQNLGGGKFLVLQQNSLGRQYVTLDSLDLSGMSAGTVWVYEPVAR